MLEVTNASPFRIEVKVYCPFAFAVFRAQCSIQTTSVVEYVSTLWSDTKVEFPMLFSIQMLTKQEKNHLVKCLRSLIAVTFLLTCLLSSVSSLPLHLLPSSLLLIISSICKWKEAKVLCCDCTEYRIRGSYVSSPEAVDWVHEIATVGLPLSFLEQQVQPCDYVIFVNCSRMPLWLCTTRFKNLLPCYHFCSVFPFPCDLPSIIKPWMTTICCVLQFNLTIPLQRLP